MVVPGYGFLLNNSLRNFTTSGSTTAINRPQPGKRPRSFISPTLVFTPAGQPRMVTGSAGGGAIPAIVSGVISSVLDHGKTIEQAIAAPRFENENQTMGSSRRTQYESVPFSEFVLPDALVQELSARGQTMLIHTVGSQATSFGASQGIEIDPVTGALSRGRDPRRGGDF
jgi:gamma-glutamyltranspeptidase/glutathione hydrolase